MAKENSNIGEKLQAMPKTALYAVLFVLTTIPLFFPVHIPNKEAKASVSFYDIVKNAPADKPILISSDWTNSTRGESAGEFKALMRILMRKNIKFVVFSMGDPQAPRAAVDVIRQINEERKLKGERTYERWTDWIGAGYFPGAEAISNAMENNFRTAFQDKKDKNLQGIPTPVFESPVMQNVKKLSDFSTLIIVTGSKTSNIAIERVKSTPITLMVTGVMGPEMQVYYDSGQVKGLVSGLKGLYDVENKMEADFPGQVNLDNGAKYYPTLHIALVLLILAVIVGNLGMYLTRKRAA